MVVNEPLANTGVRTTAPAQDRGTVSARIPLLLSIWAVGVAFASLGIVAAWSGNAFVPTKMVLILAAMWFISVIGFGIESAITRKKARDRIEELEALREIAWSLVGIGTTAELLDLFTRTIKERMDASVSAVYLADDSSEVLTLSSACGTDEYSPPVGERYDVVSQVRRPGFHTGHTAKAFTSMDVQTKRDVFVDVDFVPWRIVAGEDGCAISLPLVDNGKALGVIDLYFRHHEQLTRQRIKLLTAIAASATPMIKNTGLQRTTFGGIEHLDLAA